MSATYLLVQKTLELGYLSLEAETQLKALVSDSKHFDDADVLMVLKQAIAFGHVKRQASELKSNVPQRAKLSYRAA
jgi:hypothetical protein